MKIYNYGKFVVSEENIIKRKLNYKKIKSFYYNYFVEYINAGIETNKILYIEKAFRILYDLEKLKPYHRDIMRIYRFIKKENDGTNEKLRKQLLQLQLQGKTYHSNQYLTVYR